jgi:hypothetical protein
VRSSLRASPLRRLRRHLPHAGEEYALNPCSVKTRVKYTKRNAVWFNAGNTGRELARSGSETNRKPRLRFGLCSRQDACATCYPIGLAIEPSPNCHIGDEWWDG